MEKASYNDTNYKNVSALESTLLNKVSENGLIVFGVREVWQLTGFSRVRVHNLLASLAKKGILAKILRNRYCLKGAIFEKPFAVATNAFVPSYVSFWSALSFYGFTEQQPAIVQIVTPKQFGVVKLKEIAIESFTFKPKSFFGYIKLKDFAIAFREKALVDSAVNFENVGGFNEFVKCLRNAWSEVNKSTFVEFLLKMGNKSLNSRIGYLVECLRLPLSKGLLKKIHANKSIGFVKLNSAKSRVSNYNKKWNVIVNDSIELEKVL